MKRDAGDYIFLVMGIALAVVVVAVAFWIVWHIGIDIGFWDDKSDGGY